MVIVSVLLKTSLNKMPKSTDPHLRCVIKEIEKYLSEHPKAADTLEGSTEWWLLRLRYRVSSVMVQQALEYLVLTSVVEININVNGNNVYSSKKTEH